LPKSNQLQAIRRRTFPGESSLLLRVELRELKKEPRALSVNIHFG